MGLKRMEGEWGGEGGWSGEFPSLGGSNNPLFSHLLEEL